MCDLAMAVLLGLLWLHAGLANGGLSEEYPRGGEAPHIIEQPLDVTVARHQPATLNCRAGGTPPPTVRWYKAGVLVQADTHKMLLPAGGLFFLRTTHGRAHSDAGVYWCEATNPYGTARSRNATLHVAVLREDFRLEPASTQTAQGETVILECSPPRGSPEPTVFWKKDDQVMHFDGDTRMHLVDGGSLVIQDARQSDAGRYQCIARNAAGTRESTVATLRIHIKPYLITGPEDVTARTGGSVTFQCRVGGDPLPDVLWRRNAGGGNMPLGRVKVLDDRSLRLDDVTIGDEGEYTCEADNSVGAVSASGFLTVYDPPTIALKPSHFDTDVGSDAKFMCSAAGRPVPSIFWSLEGNRSIILPGTSKGQYHASHVIDGVTTLTINNTSKNNSGSTIVCSAVNFAGSAFVRGKLSVTSDDDWPPPIIVYGPSNQTLPIKSKAEFPCSSIGSPMPTITWYHEGDPILPNHRKNISKDGSLFLRDIEKSDSGIYTCVATSRHGKYVWSGVLVVDVPTNPSLHFFRAPDISTLPGAPSKPHIYNQTENSVTITWNQSNKIGSSSLIGYRVEMFSRELISNQGSHGNSRNWIVLGERIQSKTYTVKSLSPGVTYMFIVRAENSHGLSPPSPISESIMIGQQSNLFWDGGFVSNASERRSNLMTDDIIELIEASPIDSSTVKIMWEVLNFYYLEGIFIYYKQIEDLISDNDFEMITISHSNDISGYEITSLKKFKKYEFFLIPFYKKFEGKPSNSRACRTLDDVPDGPPQDIEMAIINSTTVHLKWSPPEKHLQNGIISSYNIVVNWIDLPANRSMVAINTTVNSANSLIMTNLTSGITYSVQISAATSVGSGPFSQIIYLNIESRTVGTQSISRYPNNDVSIVAGDFVLETWFLVLIGVIALFKVIIVGGIIYFRKNNLFTKKSALPNIYDSNGTSLVTQMNIKTAVSLSHPLSNCYNKNTVTKTDSLLWMENQPGIRMNTNKSERCKEKMNPEYDKVINALPEYAEVTSARVGANEWNTSKTATSPAAYASVTLVNNSRQCVSSLGWFPSNKNVDGFDKGYPHDEEIYPSSNGGYFNRNVYGEKFFQNQPNILKFYDIPSIDNKAQKAQIRYNHNIDDDRRSERGKSEVESLVGRPYGVSSRKNSESDATYRAFDDVESDEDNYEEGAYDELQAMRPKHQYAKPDFDAERSRALARLTSFTRQAQLGTPSHTAPPSRDGSVPR